MTSINASLGPAPSGFARGTGPELGLLLLDTTFERLPGDLGRADSWPVEVATRVVRGAFPREIVRDASSMQKARWGRAFIDAGRDLVSQGVRALTTSCGFLVLLRQELEEQLPVPVVTSALELLPDLLARELRVGVLTIDADALGDAHLRCAGVPDHRLQDVLVQGVHPGGAFARRLLAGEPHGDAAAAGQDVVAAAKELQRRAPDLRAVVLECTNMPPHGAAVAAGTGWQVLSLLDSPVLRRAALGRWQELS